MTCAIAIGTGLRDPRAERVELDATASVDALGLAMHLHTGAEGWWSPSTFTDRRSQATWSGAWTLAVDVDHEPAHRGGPWPWRDRVRARRALETAPGTLAHMTPRGMRVVALLDEPVTTPETFARASSALCSRVRAWVDREGLAGLVVDEAASRDRARLLYTPRATVDGRVRRARVVTAAAGVAELDDLLSDAPPPASAENTYDRHERDAIGGEGEIPSGARNVTLTRLAGSLRRVGLDETEIRAALRAANVRRCLPPLPDPEVVTIARSAGTWPAGTDGSDGASGAAFDLIDAVALAEAMPPTRYVLPRFRFAAGRPSGVAGYAGGLKTWMGCDLGLAVGSGARVAWGDVPVTVAGPVVHLDYEMGAAVRRRYQRLANGRGVDLAGLGARLRVASLPRLYLTSPGAEDVIARACDGAAMLLIDSLRAATPDAKTDENASAIRRYIDLLTRVSERTGAVVVVLLHEGKVAPNGDDGRPRLQRMRGSSAIADAFGAAVAVTTLDDGVARIEQTKVSLGPAGNAAHLRLVDCGAYDVDRAETEGVTIETVGRAASESSPSSELDADAEHVLSVIVAHPGVGKAELRKLAGRSNPRTDAALDRLLREGRAEQRPTGKRQALFAPGKVTS